jgi:hypothetical protein
VEICRKSTGVQRSEPGLSSSDKRGNFLPYAGVSPSVSVVAKPDCVGRTTEFRNVQIERYIKEGKPHIQKEKETGESLL